MLGLGIGLHKNRFSGGGGATPLLLDTYTNSVAAWSLRKLRTDYSGSAIRVRRASDNTETNIGFVNNELDISTLQTFCSGTNGFVTTIYDQKGSNNFVQTNALRQGIIVSSGVVNLLNGKPIILRSTDNNGGYLASGLDFVSDTNVYGSYFVIKRPLIGNFCIFSSNFGGSDYGIIGESGSTSTNINNLVVTSSRKLNNATPTYTTRGQVYTSFANQSLFSLGVQFNYSFSGYSLGYRYNSPGNLGMTQFQEHILFTNLDNRDAIDSNINSYFNIY